MPAKLWHGTRALGTFAGPDIELEVHACGNCGLTFALDKGYMKARRDDHDYWYCPGCKASYHFSGESELEREVRLREEAEEEAARAWERARARQDLLEHETRSHAATKGHLTRQRKRAVAGVCPVPGCQRHFKDVQRHVASKHPGFKPTHE